MSKYEFAGRTEQSKAAGKRLIDAQRLQKEKRWRGAMYLAGYSIECRLKARLMEIFNVRHLPELDAELERRVGHRIDVYTHSIEVLFTLTGARERLLKDTSNPALRAFQQCNIWRPAWRYSPDDGTEDACITFMEAVDTFGRFLANNV